MIDLKKLDEQQLSLLIHNCNVYGISNKIKQEYINELNKLENDSNL